MGLQVVDPGRLQSMTGRCRGMNGGIAPDERSLQRAWASMRTSPSQR